MSDLLLKATPALLDGWCGPVVLGRSGEWAVSLPSGEIVFGDEGAHVEWATLADLSAVHLDLARAECRDRVARVVASVQGLHHEVDQWYWLHVGALGHSQSWRTGEQVWTPSPMAPRLVLHSAPTRGWRPGDTINVECLALADLDPRDDRRLPDGSRWVDAMALLLVAREVAGE